MATVIKITGKNVGKDVSVTITDSLGTQVNAAEIGIMTHFEVDSDLDHSETKSIVNGGQVFNESIPGSYKVTMKFARTKGVLEEMEDSYRRSSRNGTQLEYKLQYQVRNRDGSVTSKMLHHGKPLKFNLGGYSGGAGDVPQSVDFVFGEGDATSGGSGTFTGV